MTGCRRVWRAAARPSRRAFAGRGGDSVSQQPGAGAGAADSAVPPHYQACGAGVCPHSPHEAFHPPPRSLPIYTGDCLHVRGSLEDVHVYAQHAGQESLLTWPHCTPEIPCWRIFLQPFLCDLQRAVIVSLEEPACIECFVRANHFCILTQLSLSGAVSLASFLCAGRIRQSLLFL